MFDYTLLEQPSAGREGFLVVADAFMEHVRSFGKDIDFPSELTLGLNENALSRLLFNCEFRPDLTFFIEHKSEESLFSIVDGKEYRMYGDNGKNIAFRHIGGRHIDVVDADDVHTIYYSKENPTKSKVVLELDLKGVSR
jgi:hypothetical protein